MLIIVLIFVIWLGYEIKKSRRAGEQQSKEFWDRENEALLSARKSTADILFIEVPDEIIPPVVIDAEDEDSLSVNTLISELESLRGTKIADLSEYTNTDLRIKYGTANFTWLSEADTRFASLVRIMSGLITLLVKTSRSDDARILIDYCGRNGISTRSITEAAAKL